MPIYDIECERCHKVIEVIESIKTTEMRRCIVCGGRTKKVFTSRRSSDNLVDAPWLKSVLDVVSKNPDAPMADRIFLRNPTRRNYKAWMNSRRLRPLEPGEGPSKPQGPDMEKIGKEIWARDVERRRINVHGNFGVTHKR